ncbi:MAG TPA: AAA family ATPase [Pirellulales bacterium]|nr:AAA family ATPase [Pirellulales bacterium]
MASDKSMIERLKLSGFKSIRQADIELGKLNVLIGANGAGKSNLVSFFEMLRASLDAKLDGYVARHGGPSAFLHLGPKQTSEIATAITARTAAGTGTLHQRLLFRAPDALAFSDNHAARPNGADRSNELVIDDLCSVINDERSESHPGQLIYRSLKDRTGIYHFHDTTLAAPVRTAGYLEDSRVLHGDAGNLAAFLYRLQQTQAACYQRIRSTIRMATSFFDDFSLAPRPLDPRRILLNWKQLGSDYELGPHQLSDGTLRFMALTALLLQPADELPDLIVVDEPELGLHPSSLNVVASLLKMASHSTQVVVATQSARLLDEFDPEQVIVVDREGTESTFRRLDAASTETWLEEYSLGEVWEKNVFGGGPY